MKLFLLAFALYVVLLIKTWDFWDKTLGGGIGAGILCLVVTAFYWLAICAIGESMTKKK